MKTSWSEIQHTEQYLSGKLKEGDSLIYEARLLIHPALKLNMHLQKKIYSMITAYGRKQTKKEIATLHDKLFSHPDKINFQNDIHQLFVK